MYSEKILGGKWFKKGVTADLKRCFLKLEINEWLQIGSDELIDNGMLLISKADQYTFLK